MCARRIILCIGIITSCVVCVLLTGDESRGGGEKDHGFTGKVLYVVTKSALSKGEQGHGSGSGVFEYARVINLGNRPFLVAQVAEYGEGPWWKEAAGKRVWTPIAEIVQITEFKDVAEAMRYFNAARKPAEGDSGR
jgi:hypothetical protein